MAAFPQQGGGAPMQPGTGFGAPAPGAGAAAPAPNADLSVAAPMLRIDTQHQDMIHDAQLDYYAKKLATCSSDRMIKIYELHGDPPQQTHVADLAGHDGPVWEVAWAHPKFGVLLASCGYDRKVIVHREAQPGVWQQIKTYAEHESSVNSVSWGPHEYGLCLACASSDGRVTVLRHNDDDTWSAQQFQDSTLGVNSVSWAPYNSMGNFTEGYPTGNVGADGRQELAGAGQLQRLVTGSCDNVVRVWRLDPGARDWHLEHTLKQHSDWVRDVAWAPFMGVPCNTLASCGEDGAVHIWRQESAGGPWTASLLKEFGHTVWRVSWSVTGSVLAVSSGEHSVTLWKESLDRSWVQISSIEDPGAEAAPGQ